jgi:hypothetical protein
VEHFNLLNCFFHETQTTITILGDARSLSNRLCSIEFFHGQSLSASANLGYVFPDFLFDGWKVLLHWQ